MAHQRFSFSVVYRDFFRLRGPPKSLAQAKKVFPSCAELKDFLNLFCETTKYTYYFPCSAATVFSSKNNIKLNLDFEHTFSILCPLFFARVQECFHVLPSSSCNAVIETSIFLSIAAHKASVLHQGSQEEYLCLFQTILVLQVQGQKSPSSLVSLNFVTDMFSFEFSEDGFNTFLTSVNTQMTFHVPLPFTEGI